MESKDPHKLIKKRTEENYSTWLKDGFRYATNILSHEVQKYKERYEESGLIFRIGETAFAVYGNRDVGYTAYENPNLRAIFVKKKGYLMDFMRKILN